MRLSVPLFLVATTAVAQTQLPMPPFGSTFSSTIATRGYYFQTPVPIVITGLRVPDESGAGVQCVEVIQFAGPAPAYPATASGGQVFYDNSTPSGQFIACSLPFNAGDWIGVLGACGTATMNNSYGTPAGAFASSIGGQPVTLTRLLTQTNLSTTGGNQPYSSETAGAIARVELLYVPAAGFASFSRYGAGCGGGGAPGLYEQFTASSANDLQQTGLTLLNSGASYIALQGSNPIATPTGAATPFGDDQTQAVALPWSFPHPTGSTSTLWICSNGWISLEATTSTTFTESAASLLAETPRLCAWWDDLNPGNGGAVHTEVDPTNPALFHVTWSAVPEYLATGANTFQISLDASGTVEFKWDTMSAIDGLVGYHPGRGRGDPGATDLTAISAVVLGDGTLPLALTNLNGSRPVLGQIFQAQVREIPAGAAIGGLVLGLTQFDPGLDLSAFGMPGCAQFTSLEHALAFFPTGAAAVIPMAFPNDATFAGVHVFAQAALLRPGANALGVIASNGGDLVVDVQ